MLPNGFYEADDSFEERLFKEWNFAIKTPMQLASHSFKEGYRAALQNTKESPADSPASPVQQLKAEIRSVCDKLDALCKQENSWLVVRQCYEKLCELSAI